MRHHRALVIAAIVALFTTCIALAVGFGIVRQERNVAQAERTIAERERDRADRESEKALQHAAATRQVVEQFLIRIADDAWSQVPRFEPFRIEMVQLAVQRYRELVAQHPDDASLASDAAMALRRCANLYRMTNQLHSAEELYVEALQISHRLIQQHPNRVGFWQRHVELLADAADLRRHQQGATGGEHAFRTALLAAAQMREKFPGQPGAKQIEARVKSSFASVLHDLGRDDESLRLAAESAATFSAFADANSELIARLSAVVAWSNLANIAREAGELPVAQQSSHEAVERSRRNLLINPQDPNVRYLLASSLVERAAALNASGDQGASADALLDEAVRILDTLVEQYPRTASHRRKLAEALTFRGERNLSAGNMTPARDDAQRAGELLDALAIESPGSSAYGMHQGLTLALLGKAALEQGDRINAAATLQKSREHLEQTLLTSPGNRFLQEKARQIQTLIDTLP
jgi:tetratricopeptide (TPR) repeat protein